MSGASHGSAASPFKHPKAVFAVAFACVVSFMGIGLVDPILPAISGELHASPSETTLLFTSYLVVTAVAMLITNWVSSRIGAKRTLIAGLVIIVVFAALAGSAGSINQIIGFRAGWGIGNALFIATSLAVIVASASGGFAGAIVLYETALGLGIAVGPLVGGTLGEISWRGPFYGVSVLMAIALIATVVLVEDIPKPAPTSLAAPFKALRHRGLLTMVWTYAVNGSPFTFMDCQLASPHYEFPAERRERLKGRRLRCCGVDPDRPRVVDERPSPGGPASPHSLGPVPALSVGDVVLRIRSQCGTDQFGGSDFSSHLQLPFGPPRGGRGGIHWDFGFGVWEFHRRVLE